MVRSRTLSVQQVSLLLIGQQGLGRFFPLAGGLCKLNANAGGKLQIQQQASSQSTFIIAQLYSTCDELE
jgi:hypothetical protein